MLGLLPHSLFLNHVASKISNVGWSSPLYWCPQTSLLPMNDPLGRTGCPRTPHTSFLRTKSGSRNTKALCLPTGIPREPCEPHIHLFPTQFHDGTDRWIPPPFFMQAVPFGPKMNYWMLMNKMVVAGSKALRGEMVWNGTYVNLSNMIM